MDLEEVWRIREEEVYPRLFGQPSEGIFPVDPDFFRRANQTWDPRWLTHGVIRFATTAQRPSWLYVTSGLSNPWEVEPEDYDTAGQSGSGVEFVMQTAEKADWAIVHLRNILAFELLLEADRFPGKEPLYPGDRIPLRESIDGRQQTPVTFMLATLPEGIAEGFELPSGKAEFLHFTGVTEDEAEFARAGHGDELLERLRARGYHPMTVPDRPSVA